MSDIFHKSCYTSRSSGYKYRTLSTNTGERRKRDDKDDNVFERKFKELKKNIVSRIDKEVDKTQAARELIQERFAKVDSKINSMLDLRQTVMLLREDLTAVENNLVNLIDRVYRLELAANDIEAFNDRALMSVMPVFDEREIFSSTIAHT